MPHLADNRQARHDYHILETFEAGIILTGPEVKSAKAGQVNLRGSYVTIKDNAAWLVNCHIAPYKPANLGANYIPTRTRKLLLQAHELATLIGKSKAQGQTLIPLSVYTKRGLVKVQIALARGKKLHDKRATIKKREAKRSIERAIRMKS
ncbi:MAG: SsrA-binding protein SmpB [Candidatus Kerfeldbacteria bacterium]|nr:SsrA-binding protein SmpB [Candidatus Kerfeldbacteria bacterium]